MKYKTYNVYVWFGENCMKSFENLVATSIEAALADIQESYADQITFHSYSQV
jgi:hypothetical protein